MEPGEDRVLHRHRNQPVERAPGRELARLDADDLPEPGDAPPQVRLRYADLRTGQGEPRLGLGDVGAGHLADVEAVARLPQLLLEDLDVVAAEVEVSRVAQHVHIGGRAIEQHVLLGRAQGLARAEHERLGLLHRIVRAKAVEQRLIDRHPDAARRRARHGRRVHRPVRAAGSGVSLSLYCAPTSAMALTRGR